MRRKVKRRSCAYLSAGHQVSSIGHDWNRILLNGGGVLITSVADVFQKDGVQRGAGENSDRVWHASTSGFHRNVIILVEVDTGVLLRGIDLVTVEFLLEAGVASTDVMLAVLPETETGLTRAAAAAAAASSAGGSPVAATAASATPIAWRATVIGERGTATATIAARKASTRAVEAISLRRRTIRVGPAVTDDPSATCSAYREGATHPLVVVEPVVEAGEETAGEDAARCCWPLI
jgi:hypothetical protein